jgi:hypothetical protein
MNNEQIKTLVVPRLFEKVGAVIANKRNGIGSSFNLTKNKPITAGAIKQINETFSGLTLNEKFRIDQYITIIEQNYAYKNIEPLVEQALESNDEEKIVESMKKIGSMIIKYIKGM